MFIYVTFKNLIPTSQETSPLQKSSSGMTYITACITTGWTAGVRLPAEARDISLLHSVQTGSGAHSASNSTGGLLHRG
jgi:hypothetical protein